MVATNQGLDLDAYLTDDGADASGAQRAARGMRMPDADRVQVVGIFLDDSNSIRHAGLTKAVRTGAAMGIDALRGAKGCDFYVEIRGFEGKYASGLLQDLPSGCLARYNPYWPATPLITETYTFLQNLHAEADRYRSMGIPTTVALIILTDGLPNNDQVTAQDFATKMALTDFLVGIGVGNTDADAKVFRALFKSMGICTTLTPKNRPSDVRAAIYQASRSVATIGTRRM